MIKRWVGPLGGTSPCYPFDTLNLTAEMGFLEERQDLTLDEARMASGWWLARKTFDVTLTDARTHRIGVKALAEAFAHSPSFDPTREMWALVEGEPEIEPEQLRRLEFGVQSNRQVYEAVRKSDGKPIPDLVKELVARLEPPTEWGPDVAPF